MQSLRDLEEKEVEAWVLEHHFPRYRAEQIFRWVQEKDVTDFSEMEHRVYFHAGGLQDGLRVLCFDAIGPRKKLQLRRNARANCCDRASYGKKDFQCCADGIGRTLG